MRLNDSLPTESQVVGRGVSAATVKCLGIYGQYRFGISEEHIVDGASSSVDYVATVNKALYEVKSPSVTKKVHDSLLPVWGISWNGFAANLLCGEFSAR